MLPTRSVEDILIYFKISMFEFNISKQIYSHFARLRRRVPLVEQELFTIPVHLSSPPVFSGVPVTRSLVLCVCFVDSFCSFRLAIVLSLLRFTDSDYPFGIFKLFLPLFKLSMFFSLPRLPTN